MILQSASRKEVTRIAIGSGICACVQVLVFWLLSLLGIGTFSYRILTGTVGGTLMAILCFALMCITLQKATANASDEKLVKTRVRNGYNLRKLLQILWVIAAFLIPGVNVLSAHDPAFLPQCGHLLSADEGKALPCGRRRSQARCTGPPPQKHRRKRRRKRTWGLLKRK